jgi:hypothetical protein
VPDEGWQVLSCGDGSKGARLYESALIATASPGRQLLVRRSLVRGQIGTFELAYFACQAPGGATAELVAVAGARWAVEDCFAEAKNETGLDHYQVRTWIAWYRYVTLSMLAHAFLAVLARASRPVREPAPEEVRSPAPGKKGNHGLWTTIRATQNLQPAAGHDRQQRQGTHPAYRQ